tara:strand:+ start:740 stop:1408 length:669 start_codon:yes stop_codon:yes gene_type:complete
MIKLKNIEKTYQTGNNVTPILSKQSLDINTNSSIAITGPSGCGKSTILRMIAGLEEPSSGDILINDQSIFKLTDQQRADIRRKHFGFIFQSFRLFPQLTVFENVQLACDISNITPSKDIALQWLKEVNLLKQQHQKPDTLSGGEQQRVAIARALATNPSIILADEPTGNLDQHNSNTIKSLLTHCLTLSKATLILVTHDLNLVSICNTHYHLNNAQLNRNDT